MDKNQNKNHIIWTTIYGLNLLYLLYFQNSKCQSLCVVVLELIHKVTQILKFILPLKLFLMYLNNNISTGDLSVSAYVIIFVLILISIFDLAIPILINFLKNKILITSCNNKKYVVEDGRRLGWLDLFINLFSNFIATLATILVLLWFSNFAFIVSVLLFLISFIVLFRVFLVHNNDYEYKYFKKLSDFQFSLILTIENLIFFSLLFFLSTQLNNLFYLIIVFFIFRNFLIYKITLFKNFKQLLQQRKIFIESSKLLSVN
jgi:hypothetical protein